MFKEAKNSLLGDAEIVFQDFVVPGSTRPVDSTGHGTRVAYFLLQITRNVDLYMTKGEGAPILLEKLNGLLTGASN